MGRNTKAVGKPAKKRRPGEAANKPRSSPKTKRARSSKGVNREAKVAKLTRGLREALEHQAATADILKVIASSPSDVQPVFDAIAETSNRLIAGHSTSVLRFFDDVVELAAFTPVDAEADAALQASYPLAIADLPHFELVRDGEVVQIADTESAEGIRVRDIARARGWRSVLLTPLSSDKGPIGQLTAGIAHEIKNPLNFVNNFSAVSVDLIDEMQETLEGMHEDKRAEMNQLIETLRGNLDKVVQHGKRADSIVKNMLLHSREGTGEHRPVDINAIVDDQGCAVRRARA